MRSGKLSHQNVDDKGKEEAKYPIDKLISDLLAMSEAKRFIRLMSVNEAINNGKNLVLAMQCIHNEQNFMQLLKVYDSLIVTGDDFLSLLRIAPENKRLYILMHHQQLASLPEYLDDYLNVLSPNNQITFLKTLLESSCRNPAVLCRYVEKIKIESRYDAIKMNLHLVTNPEVIITLLNSLPDEKKINYVEAVNFHINKEDVAEMVLACFPAESRDEVKSKFRYLKNEMQPLVELEEVKEPALQETTDITHAIENHPAKAEILNEIKHYLNLIGKLHEKRVRELLDTVTNLNEISDVRMLIKHQHNQINSIQNTKSYIDLSYTHFLKNEPGHKSISVGYKRLLNNCERILDKHQVRDTQFNAPTPAPLPVAKQAVSR